jgi:periplasmic protein TonB
LFVTNTLPEMPTMMAFDATAVPSAPAPPPPPPPAPRAKETPANVTTSNPNAAPVAAPSRIEPEPARSTDGDNDKGVVDGVEGGISGGIVGGMVGGLATSPPPPQPPAEPPRAPLRIGGEIHPPALLRRVDPVYSELALSAHVEGR